MKIRTLLFATLTAFSMSASAAVQITKSEGWLETAYAEWTPLSPYTNYHAYVRPAGGEYTQLDAMLLRNYGSYMRVDALGLKAGKYQLKVVPVDGSGNEVSVEAAETRELTVAAHDRNGFAHFKYSKGVGAYNNDGTLKAGAKVFYVTKNTAKTITTEVVTGKNGSTTTCTGMQTIINAYQKGLDKTPLAFRIIGTITNGDMDDLLSGSEGLQVKGRNAYSEMNITIEGVGNDATINGFGFLIRNCASVEVRNIAIINFMDDGLSLDTNNERIWCHHIDLFYGTAGGDADQAKGDGSFDLKGQSRLITLSYTHFWDSGKSSLCGMGGDNPNYITYHHNWFDHSDSRHPRVRNMSVHVYNNLFDGVAKYCVGVTTGACAFVENNHFLNACRPMLISKQGTDINNGVGSSDETKGTFSGEDGGIIKSFNNKYEGGNGVDKRQPWSTSNTQHFDYYEAKTRSEKVPSTVKSLQGGNTYNNFDTDASLMPSFTPDPVEDVYSIVTGALGAGRCEKGDLQFTFTAADNADYNVNKALKALVTNYKTTLVGIVGGTESGSGTGGGDDPDNPDNPDDPITGPSTGEYECHFTGKKPSSTFYTISGNYASNKGSYKAPNGTTYTDCLKMESSTSVTFTTDKEFELFLGFSESAPTIKIDGSSAITGANNVIRQIIPAGSHTVKKANTANLFYINLYSTEETAIDNAQTRTISFNGTSILNPEGKFFRLFTVSGSSLGSSNRTEVNMEYLPTGIYIVVAEGETLRFVVR